MKRIPLIESLEVRQFLSAAPVLAQPVSVSGPVAASTASNASGTVLTEPVGPTFAARLGEFTFKTIDQSLTAEITWGDGKTSTGTLVGSYATGEYYVDGMHSYAAAGSYNVHVRVFAQVIGSPVRPTSPIASFTSTIKAVQPTEGGKTLTEYAAVPFTAKLGEFTFKTIDEGLDAQITWGDGSKSTGTLVGSYATGEYYVQGTHTYAQPGTYKVDVKVFAHIIGGPVIATSPVARFTSVIQAKELVPSNGGKTLVETATQPFTAKLGEFTFKTIDQLLSAVINWGDGTKSAGKLVGSYATGEYYVQGTHTYSHIGTFKVDVTINAKLAGNPNLPQFPVGQFTSVIKVMGRA